MENQIRLGSRVIVYSNTRYDERAELLLQAAIKNKEGDRRKGYKDNKYYVYDVQGIESLVGAGAHILCLNNPLSASGPFVHEVVYKKHTFTLCTKTPYAYTITPTLRPSDSVTLKHFKKRK